MYITILYKCILTQLQFAYILTKLQASDATGSYYQIRNLHLTAEVSAPPPDQLTNRLNFIRTVGGANRICTKIIIANTQEFDTNCVSLIDNIYNSSHKFAKAQSDTFGLYNDMFKIQIKYNDRSLFPRPLENQALLFNHLQACEGVPPFITKTQYDGTHQGMISTDTVENFPLKSQLTQCPKNYLAFNLNRQERVNSRGVELELNMHLADTVSTGDADTQFNYTQRVWLEVAKVITLKDGRMMCTEA